MASPNGRRSCAPRKASDITPVWYFPVGLIALCPARPRTAAALHTAFARWNTNGRRGSGSVQDSMSAPSTRKFASAKTSDSPGRRCRPTWAETEELGYWSGLCPAALSVPGVFHRKLQVVRHLPSCRDCFGLGRPTCRIGRGGKGTINPHSHRRQRAASRSRFPPGCALSSPGALRRRKPP